MKSSFSVGIVCFVLLSTLKLAAQNGHWQVIKTKKDAAARSECGMAAMNGKLYLIGGDGSKEVERYDPATQSWTKLAAAPVDMNHFEAVGYNNKVYVLEAFSGGGFPDQVPMANVYAYDIQKDSWEKGGEVPTDRRRAGAGAAEYMGKLYLVAGIQHGHSSGTTNMFDVYDPQTGSWSALPDAPHIRDHCSATVMNDKLYVVGGRNTSYHEENNYMAFFAKTVTDVDCFDFKTGKWSTLPAKLPLGSGGGAVVNLNNTLYYMGGERATDAKPNAPQKDVYYLNHSSQSEWVEADTLHSARNGMAAAVLDNKIYVASGAGGGPGGPGGPPQGMGPGNKPPSGNPPQMQMPPPQQGAKGERGSIALEVFY